MRNMNTKKEQREKNNDGERERKTKIKG